MKAYDYSSWDYDEICRLVRQKLSTKKIAIKMDCTIHNVRKYLKDNGISYGSKITHILKDKEPQLKALFNQGMNIREIAEILDMSYLDAWRCISAITNGDLRKNNGKGGAYKKSQKSRRKIPDEHSERIRKLYHVDELYLREIAERYNTTPATVSTYMRRHNIEVRNKEESMALVYKRNPELREHFRQLVYDGKTGYPSGKRESWIEAYCREWLTMKGIPFEQEFQINGEGHSYDFCVGNVLIEMDGVYWHTQEEQIKKDNAFELHAQTQGYRVIRITDKDIRRNGDVIMQSKLGFLLNGRG